MAEFALGLTKSAVEGVLTRVKSAIEEEDKQRVRVQDDLVFITGEFEMMQSFLGVANAERANNPVVRTWVKQLRDLAFDVEDCVEFVIHLDKPSRLDWVRRFTSSVICIARPPLPLDLVVADIKRLKARVEDVSQRNTRYNLISDSGSSSNSAVTVVSTPAVELKPFSAASTFHTLCEVWEEAGRKRRGTDDLKKLIMRGGSDLEVISLWGSQEAADLGTKQVIKKAYNAPQIRQEFSIRAWVKLLHPFDIDEFLESLLTQLNLAASSNRQRSSGRSHIQIQAMDGVCETDQLVQHMKEQRYLVILEDVRTAAELDDIREYLPDTKNGSRIVVSTQQLGLAISCLRKSYRVAELRKFPHGQSLCAFINKVPDCRSDMSEFIWQLRCGGVISVWGSSESTTILDSVYTSITHKSKAFENEGVEFEKHSWVEVPSPFEFDVFSRRLLLSFHGDDFVADEVEAVGRMGHQGVVQRCQRFLQEHKCLVVINGLENKDDWDSIKSTFLSMSTNGCILAITHPSVTDAGVLARYCVDKEDRAINIQYLESDSMLRRLIKGSRIHGIGGKEACRRGRLFSDRREEARNWTKKYGHVVREGPQDYLIGRLEDSGVFSLWGTGGAGKSPLARRIYYQLLLRQNDNCQNKDLGFTKFSWVDVPHPFNLMDFSWRLLLDFHSDDLQTKETIAVSMMNGQDHPIQRCLEFMSQDRCFIVINGLRSTDDWDSIRGAFSWSEASQSSIIIITNEESVATHCVDTYFNMFHIVTNEESFSGTRYLTKDCGYYGNGSTEASRFFSNRREEAVDWAMASGLVGTVFKRDGFKYRLNTTVGLASISGISGVGKSTLARYMFSKLMLYSESTFTSFSWVDVPQPFNLMEFCWRLLFGFNSDDPEAKETATIGLIDGALDHIQECREFLHKKYFVVIDGLCSTHDWDLIRDALSPENTKGCILVIANETDVATYCASKNVVNTQCLEPDDAFLLFEKVAFGGKQLSPEEIQVSKLTVAKCGRLPKVIAAIGEQYIASEGEIDFLENLNNDFMGTLETKPEFCSLKGLFGWMQSYFDGCSDALKPCVFYLSVFPIVSNIRRGRLLRRWIAEGYSRDKFGITAEKDGENLVLELVGLSIIQEPTGQSHYDRSEFNDPDSKVDNVFQVNGFFHEYIISRQLEDNLVFALEGHCDLNSQRVGQHLTIRSCWDRDEIVFESIDLSRLRSLTVFGKWRPFFISTAAGSSNMRLLRVLDLEDTSGVTNDDFEQIGKLLPRLKYLSVRGCKEITRMPDSLGGLRQLQTLDVSHTKITKLPCVIINLVKLQYLCAGTTLDQPAAADHDDMSRGKTSVAEAISAMDGDVTITSEPAAADHDDMSRSQTAVADHDDMSRSQTAVADHDDMSRSQTAVAVAIPAMDSDVTSTIEPAAADHDDMSRSQTAVADHDDMSRSQTAVADHDDMSRSQTAVAVAIPTMDGDVTSTIEPAAADHDNKSRSQTAVADHDDMSRSQTAVADHDDMSRSQTAVAVAIPAMDGDVTSTIEPAATAPAPAEGENSSSTLMQWRRKTRNLVQSYSCSWSSMKKKKQFDNGGGVKVHAAGFGKLTALHSLGIVNVSGAGGNAILKEMKKLTQLHNLWVSGVNQKNWHNLCSVISDHGHLESLSVRLDYEQEGGLCSLNDIPKLPNTLNRLKFYGGNVCASPAWILRNRFFQDRHLDLIARIELTISTQEDMDSLKSLPYVYYFPNLCVKPIQDGELRYGWDEYNYTSFRSATVFKIECNSYKLALVFGPHSTEHVEVLEVNCSSATESSLKISGLENLRSLKEVCLKGSYSDELRKYMQQKVDCLEAPHASSSSSQDAQDYKKPVLNLEPRQSAPSTPCASLKRLFT